MFTSNLLLQNGIYVNPVFPPVVPQDSCLLRSSYMATHSDEQLELAAQIIERCFAEIDAMDRSQFDINF